jgi:hypothetical protein
MRILPFDLSGRRALDGRAAGGRAAGGRLWIALACGAALATRAPMGLADRPFHDEPAYALIAAYWLEGLAPYRDVWDVKPPGLFALYALAQALGASPLASVWILPLLAVCANALALCAIGREWFGDVRVGAAAAVLFAIYSLAEDGARGPAIVLAAPFIAWGLLLARRPQALHVGMGGLLIGCGAMILQSVAFEAALACGIVCVAGRAGLAQRARRLLALALGGLAPALGFGVAFHMQGAFADLWETVVVVALQRSTDHGVSFWDGVAQNFRIRSRPFLPIFVGALLMAAERAWLTDARQRASALIVLAWFVFAAAGVLVQRAAYTTYLLALVSPLCLGAGLFAVHAMDRLRAPLQRICFRAAAILAAIYPAYWIALEMSWGYSIGVLREAAQVIVERARAPGEGAGLYAVDYEPSLHLLTGQRPVSRFIFSMHMHCGFVLPDGIDAREEILRTFARAPRFVVRRDETRYGACIRPALSALVYATLDDHYELVRVLGRIGEVRVYELREGMAARLRALPARAGTAASVGYAHGE